MSDTLISAQIVSILSNTAGVANVYGSDKLATFDSQFKSLFVASNKVNFWLVCRINTEEKKVAMGFLAKGSTEMKHTYRIEGHYGFSDAGNSEGALNALLDAVCASFRANPTLNKTCFYHTYIKASNISQANVQGRLCNKCTLTLTVFELI